MFTLVELTVIVFLMIDEIHTVDVNFTEPYKSVTSKFIISIIKSKKVKFQSIHYAGYLMRSVKDHVVM